MSEAPGGADEGAPGSAPGRTVVVVPCFDEARRLDPEAFAGFVAEHPGVDFVFVDDEQITDLDAVVTISPASTLLFVRLVPLAGG